MENVLRAIIGAVVALSISYFSKSKLYFVAGMVPLFPTFAILSQIIVGQDRTLDQLRESVLFGMLSLIAYLGYLISMYFSLTKMSLTAAILLSTAVWFVLALPMVLMWK